MSSPDDVCPICGNAAARRPANPFGPFCSKRCQQVDLGRWFEEDYRIPAVPDEGEDGEDLGTIKEEP